MNSLRLTRLLFFLFSFFFFAGQASEKGTLKFEENKNQWDPKVLFKTDLQGGSLFLEKNTFTYLFYNASDLHRIKHHSDSLDITMHFHSFKVELLNAAPGVRTKGNNPGSYYKNYFIGNDESKWASDVKLYEEVTYAEIFPSINMHVYSQENNLKYDFILQPGADADILQLRYTGVDRLYLKDGNLNIQTSLGTLVEQKPYVYQLVNNKRVEVPSIFTLKNNIVGFAFPKGYDETIPLVIDPTLVCSSFTGSTADNWGYTATYDAAGNIYAGGISLSFGYPLTVGAYQSTFAGGGSGGAAIPSDIAISKFDATGASLLYSTYLGGTDNEQPQSLVVNNNNELLIYGRTYSSNFPTTPGAFNTLLSGGADIIVAKFNSTGTSLLASTFVGGTFDDGVNIAASFFSTFSLKYNYADDGRGEIVVDNNNNCYVVSSTQSSNFPVTTGAHSTLFSGGLQDACVFKLDNSLSTMLWNTYLGGNSDDAGYSLALDGSQNIYVTGGTSSTDFPITTGVLNTVYGGGIADGYVTCLQNNGAAILNSTYVGTSGYDQSFFVQLDNSNNVYIYGQTSGAYPVTSGVYSNANSGQFIHKMNSTLTSTIFSTVFGSGSSSPNISPTAFLVDNCENIYAAGWGGSCIGLGNQGSTTGLPVTSNAYQSTTDGCDFYFLMLSQNAAALSYATFFGGGIGTEEHVDGGTSRFDKKGIIYQSVCAGCGGSSNFPTTAGAWSVTNNSSNCNNAVIKMDFQFVGVSAQAVAAPSTSGCAPFTVNFTNNSINAVSYVWNFGDGSPINTSSSPSHTFSNGGIYNVMLIATDPASCNISDTTYVTVTSEGVNLGSDTALCGGSSFLLDAGNPGSTYLWSTGETTQIITPSAPGLYWITINNSLCVNTDSILVSPDGLSSTKTPNVFTPNNDGINETFDMGIFFTEESALKIYNRWGQLMYETDDMSRKWDGSSKGKALPDGVYFWVLSYKSPCKPDEVAEEKGFVTLLR